MHISPYWPRTPVINTFSPISLADSPVAGPVVVITMRIPSSMQRVRLIFYLRFLARLLLFIHGSISFKDKQLLFLRSNDKQLIFLRNEKDKICLILLQIVSQISLLSSLYIKVYRLIHMFNTKAICTNQTSVNNSVSFLKYK